MNYDNNYVVGIDIGGTNTDAVLVNSSEEIVYACKATTTENIVDGFTGALTDILHNASIPAACIKEILIGTTHTTNALLQGRDLYTVGVIRIAGHNPQLLPPCYTWPLRIRDIIYRGSTTVNGGFECHRKAITQFSSAEVEQATYDLLENGVESIAIIGVFSPLNNEQELLAKEIVQRIAGHYFPVTISSAIGGIGFIERENSAILNCALKKSILNGFSSLKEALKLLSIKANLLITQNNGTVISLDAALEFPILTISAGPTNSFIGGTRLAGLADGIVADIGGTSTDIGIVNNNFPRRTLNNSYIADIVLNFSMPDVISMPLGGGSYIANNNKVFTIGPASSGRNLQKESYAFGGNHLTLTDAALVCGALKITNIDSSQIPLSSSQGLSIIKQVRDNITALVQRMSLSKQKLPLILVGGGAHLIPSDLFSEEFPIYIPSYAHVANAYGAALAEISGTIDVVVSLTDRDALLNKLKDEALQLAINQGAYNKAVRIISQQIIPYHYVPNNLARVIIIAAGKRKVD